MSRTCLIAALLFVSVTGIASAGAAPPVTHGSRLRVSIVGKTEPLTGTVSALSDTAVTMQVGPMTRIIPCDRIEHVSISRGKRSRGRGALIGAGLGAAVGVIVGFASGDDPEDEWFALEAKEKATVCGVVFGLAGALVGVVVPPGEKWEPADICGARVSCRPMPGGGAGLVVTAAF